MIVNLDTLKDTRRDRETTTPFFVLEGANGAGKSLLQMSLKNRLTKSGSKVFCTREPGGTELGEKIRAILLDPARVPIHARTELMLFNAARSQHVEELILPALREGNLVLCDRYFYSTIAFQGYARGIPLDLIEQVNSAAVGECIPSLVILLDLDPELGLQRIEKQRRLEGDAFEQEKIDFHRKLRKGFLEMAETRPEAFLIIDASKTPEEVLDEAESAIRIILDQKNAR